MSAIPAGRKRGLQLQECLQEDSEVGAQPVPKHGRRMTNEGEGQSRTPDKENTLPHPQDQQVGVVTTSREVEMEEDFDPETCFEENPFSDRNDGVHSSVFPFTRSSTITQQSYLTVIDSLGNSRRLIVKSDREMERKVSSTYGGQLLFVPFWKLKEAVEEKRFKKLMADPAEDMNDSINRDHHTSDIVGEGEGKERILWSEKYSPKNFTDLLSDDGINRTVLSWLKLWDETVFGSSALIKAHPGGDKKQGFRKKGYQQQQYPAKKKFKPSQWEVQDPEHFGTDQALDDARRPKQKLFLLCGPPGLGKTTLAHVVAKHAGYNVVEINASDDRSPDVFKRVLESSTEMKAVLTANSKPNCLIIDEIDGAPVTAINVLIDVIKTRNKVAKNSKKSKTVLSRPIICICNDLYTPSLRGLRQCATVIPVPQTVTGRLSARLLEICKQECMSASGSVLTALCEKTDNDIRTCLNTLQFMHGKKSDLSISSVQSLSIGKKDTHKSHLAFLKEVFKLPPIKKASIEESGGLYSSVETQTVNLRSQRFMTILSSAYSTGEYEKVLQGVYENYLEAKVRDPNLDIMSSVQDWIIFNQRMNLEVMSSQEYILMAYLPFLSVAFHFHFASSSGHRVKFPHSDFEAFQSHQKNQQLLSSLVSDISPVVKRNLSAISSVDFIPLLLQIISPSFRPVNPQLYSKWEKQVLSDVISTMISYNLTYHQEQTSDGQYTYVMDPNIEQLCSYSSSTQRKQLPYITKQMLAREIELEKVKSESKPQDLNNHKSNSLETTSSRSSSKDPVVKQVEINERKYQKDFFGRPIIPKPSLNKPSNDPDNEHAKQSSSVLSRSLWFKFNKGFSDAVKRPIRMKDLL